MNCFEMKKYFLFLVSAIVLAFISCADSEDVRVTYKHDLSLTINTSSLYEKVSLSSFQDLLGSNKEYSIGFTTLLYNSNGALCERKDELTRDLQPLTVELYDLDQDNYTLITIQYLVNSKNNNQSDIWVLENTESLKDVRISAPNTKVLWYNCIGIFTQTINLNGNFQQTITPKLAGCFVNFRCENFEYSKYDRLGLCFKNAANGLYLNPELSQTESYYYKDGFNEKNTWNLKGFFDSEEGTWPSTEQTVFVLETGNINYCFAPSNKGDDNKYYFKAYPSENEYFNFELGVFYEAYCYYKGAPTYVETFLGSGSELKQWYNNLDKGMNPIFANPFMEWGASVKDVKNYMSSNNYTIWFDIEYKPENGLYYLGYNGKYRENSTQYVFKSEDDFLLAALVNVSNEDASLDEILEQLSSSNEYAFEDCMEEYGCYVFYNKVNYIEVYPNLTYNDSDQKFTQIIFTKSTVSSTKAASRFPFNVGKYKSLSNQN